MAAVVSIGQIGLVRISQITRGPHHTGLLHDLPLRD
jgi:hypothetical protein